MKNITQIISAPDIKMGNIKLKQPLPIGGLDQHDPFLLLHHLGPKTQPPGGRNVMDIGAHPHRGFEPISFIFKGAIHHRDSRDNDSIIQAGGVQWTTAGRGIVHSEGIPKSFIEKGGEFEMIQLWVNLPKALKMSPARYQGFQKDAIPTYEDQNGQVRVNVISGEYQNLAGPIESLTGISALTLELQADGIARFDFPESKNVMLYQLNGNTEVNTEAVRAHQMVVFGNRGNDITIKAQSESLLLLLAGDPINEKVVSWGPYVMNTQTEIMEAMRDYQMGKMGVLI